MPDDDDPTEPLDSDPFWGAVRRRHPDLDIVLLPPGEGPVEPAEGAEVDPAQVAREAETLVASLWSRIVGQVRPSGRVARWTAGEVAGSLRREASWSLEEVDSDQAIAALNAAERILGDDEWHVLVPPTGMPRVAAGRAEGLGRSELLVLAVPAERRLLLRLRTGPQLVAEELRRQLEGGDPA